MVFAGLDPSGGAGIQADIETLFASGCHALPLVTALTVQDTAGVHGFLPVDTALLSRQIEVVAADVHIDAIKIGMLASPQIIAVVAGFLRDRPDLPVVLDPVLAAGGGQVLAGRKTARCLLDQLLPQTTIVTPNGPEARELTALDDLDLAARELLLRGSRYALITGGHEVGDEICNRLYGLHPGDTPVMSHWPRLSGHFHGTGCTLAAAIAARLAHGDEVAVAVTKAEQFVCQSLQAAFAVGRGQWIPGRGYRYLLPG